MALTKIGSIGINTGIQFAGVTTIATLNASDNVLSVGGTVNFVSDVSIGGTVSIAGTLTYEDVTNVDAIGIITARSEIKVGSGITLSKDGDIFATGISTFSEGIAGDLLIDDKIVHRGDTDTAIRFPAADTITAETGGSERVRISANGRVAVGNATNNANDNALFKAVADDGEAADLYVGQFINLEATAGQSYGVNIQAGSNSTDHGFRVMNRANDTTQFIVRGDGNVGVNTDLTGSQTWRSGKTLEIFGGGGNVTGELHLGANRSDANQSVGSVNFFDNGQDTSHKQIALIEADKAGSTSNKRGGDLIFYTKPDNVASPTERLRIHADGEVEVKEAAAGQTVLSAVGNYSSSSNVDIATFARSGGAVASAIRYVDASTSMLFGTTTSHKFGLMTGGTERAHIDTSGNVTLGNASYGSSLGQLRIINDASSSPASLALFGYGNTTDNDPFGQIQFAEQEAGTGGQIKAKIEAQAVSTNERGSNLVFFTSANTSSSTPAERFRITEDGDWKAASFDNTYACMYRSLSNASTSNMMNSSGTMIFSSATFSMGNSNVYNTSNGKYTAPIRGLYLFNFNGLLDDSFNSGSIFVKAYVDGAATDIFYIYESAQSGYYHHVSGSHVIALNAGQTHDFHASAGGFHISNETNFSACLIQAY